jgi:hypothetical protein
MKNLEKKTAKHLCLEMFFITLHWYYLVQQKIMQQLNEQEIWGKGVQDM